MSQIPAMLAAMRTDTGTTEVPGKGSNPKIMEKVRRVAAADPSLKWIGAFYADDDIPWCGLQVADCAIRAGFKPVLPNPLSARAWADWGDRLFNPRLGAVAVLSRDGGGHVALIEGVSADGQRLYLRGGNQSNMVKAAWFDAARVIAYCAPPKVILPPAPKLSFSGQPLSKNEA